MGSGVFRKSSRGDNPKRAHIVTERGAVERAPIVPRAIFVDLFWANTLDGNFVDLFLGNTLDENSC